MTMKNAITTAVMWYDGLNCRFPHGTLGGNGGCFDEIVLGVLPADWRVMLVLPSKCIVLLVVGGNAAIIS